MIFSKRLDVCWKELWLSFRIQNGLDQQQTRQIRRVVSFFCTNNLVSGLFFKKKHFLIYLVLKIKQVSGNVSVGKTRSIESIINVFFICINFTSDQKDFFIELAKKWT